MKKRDNRSEARPPRRESDPRGPTRRGGGSGGGGGGGASYWIYGTHAAHAALANPERRIRRILATAEAAKGLEGRRLPLALEPAERIEIDRLLPAGSVHQGIAVLVEPLEPLGIEDVGRLSQERAEAVVVVLDQVTDPHNVGAILRSAAAFGALAVVVPDRHAPEETGALAKAASGALERMPLVRVTNVVRALEELKQAGFWIAGLAADGPKTLAQAALSGKVIMALGAEGEGLRRLTREHCDHLVRLPMTQAVESLNVSNACAVALYELRRGG